MILYNTPEDELEVSLLENDDNIIGSSQNDIEEYLESLPMTNGSTKEKYEIPERKGDEDLPPPELKHLPPDLKYKFLDETNRYPVIVSTNLSEKEEEQLMMVLKMHRKAFVKGINPSIATHRIFMEDGA
jgi:hypothetical protein